MLDDSRFRSLIDTRARHPERIAELARVAAAPADARQGGDAVPRRGRPPGAGGPQGRRPAARDGRPALAPRAHPDRARGSRSRRPPRQPRRRRRPAPPRRPPRPDRHRIDEPRRAGGVGVGAGRPIHRLRRRVDRIDGSRRRQDADTVRLRRSRHDRDDRVRRHGGLRARAPAARRAGRGPARNAGRGRDAAHPEGARRTHRRDERRRLARRLVRLHVAQGAGRSRDGAGHGFDHAPHAPPRRRPGRSGGGGVRRLAEGARDPAGPRARRGAYAPVPSRRRRRPRGFGGGRYRARR